MDGKKRKTPKDAATSNGAMSAKCRTTETEGVYNENAGQGKGNGSGGNSNATLTSDGPENVIWEQRRGADLLRFMEREYRGTRFAELRAWYESDGGWKHGAKGCTMPVDSIGELGRALVAYAEKPAS